MALTVNCPKCRASMRVDDKHLGMKGRCSKCGEVFTMTAAANGAPPPEPPRPVHNPFASPFGGAPEPADEPQEPVASSSGFFGFQFAAPPPPAPAGSPTAPTPMSPPLPSAGPFEPFFSPPPEPPSRVEPAPPPPPPPAPASAWSPFGHVVEAPAAPEPPPTFEPIHEPPPPPPEPAFTPRRDAPAPVVLEVAPPAQAPLMEQKVAVVETFVVKLAGKRALRGPHGSILREGKATTRLFVRVAGTNGDAVGWSESNPLLALQGATVESTSALIRRFLRPAVEGVTLADMTALVRRLEKASPADAGPSAVAKSAVEAACLDLLARTLDAPLHILWGGARAKSASVAVTLDAESPRAVGDLMKRGKDRGATAFHLVLDGNEAKDRATLAAAGKGLPEGCTWSAGFLRGHPRDAALRLCSVAEGSGASALRGVLAAESPTELARLAERTTVSLLADVGAGGAPAVLEFVRLGGAGGVVLQPALLGWRKTWAAAAVAQAAGVRVWLAMQWEGGLGLAAAAHLAAALGTDAPILDCGQSYSETHFLAGPSGDGPFKLDDLPGTGISVDEGLLRAAAVEAG